MRTVPQPHSDISSLEGQAQILHVFLQAELYVGLLVFVGYILVDTQVTSQPFPVHFQCFHVQICNFLLLS